MPHIQLSNKSASFIVIPTCFILYSPSQRSHITTSIIEDCNEEDEEDSDCDLYGCTFLVLLEVEVENEDGNKCP